MKQIDFTVTDSSVPGPAGAGTGHISGSLKLAAYGGANYQFGKIVVGGEFSVGQLNYDGSAMYGPGADTHAIVNGGFAWTAMARAGFDIGGLLPYAGFGVTSVEHSSHIQDHCNTPPCSTTMGEGSGTTSTKQSLVAIGAELMVGEFVNATWTVRGEWVHTGDSTVVNVFQRTVTGNGALPGATATVQVTTPQPASTLRAVVSIRFGPK